MNKVLFFLKALIVVAMNRTTHSKTQRDLATAKELVDTLVNTDSETQEKDATKT